MGLLSGMIACFCLLIGWSKVAIAPPPSLIDLDIPPPEGFLQKEGERQAAEAAADEADASK